MSTNLRSGVASPHTRPKPSIKLFPRLSRAVLHIPLYAIETYAHFVDACDYGFVSALELGAQVGEHEVDGCGEIAVDFDAGACCICVWV